MRYVREFKLGDYDASVLTSERSGAEFFEAAVKAGGEAKRVCNLLTQTGWKIANEKGCGVSDLGVTPQSVGQLAEMVGSGTISATSSTVIFEAMVQSESGEAPDVLAKELNLIQKSDTGELEKIVEQVLAENAQAVADVVSGGKKSGKARGFLLGQVMQKTKGQANPKVVSEILGRKLG
jgi:aspartyl-tRNA(Asn)/glutamyl-tRNA(Gln) amidotransferase subunit B